MHACGFPPFPILTEFLKNSLSHTIVGTHNMRDATLSSHAALPSSSVVLMDQKRPETLVTAKKLYAMLPLFQHNRCYHKTVKGAKYTHTMRFKYRTLHVSVAYTM